MDINVVLYKAEGLDHLGFELKSRLEVKVKKSFSRFFVPDIMICWDQVLGRNNSNFN